MTTIEQVPAIRPLEEDFIAGEQAHLDQMIAEREAEAVVQEAEHIKAEAADQTAEALDFNTLKMTELIDAWAHAEVAGDNNTSAAVQDTIFGRIENTIGSDSFKVGLIDRYFGQMEEKANAILSGETPLEGEVDVLVDTDSVTQNEDAVAEVTDASTPEFMHDHPKTLKASATEFSQRLINIDEQPDEQLKRELVAYVLLVRDNDEVPGYVKRRIMTAAANTGLIKDMKTSPAQPKDEEKDSTVVGKELVHIGPSETPQVSRTHKIFAALNRFVTGRKYEDDPVRKRRVAAVAAGALALGAGAAMLIAQRQGHDISDSVAGFMQGLGFGGGEEAAPEAADAVSEAANDPVEPIETPEPAPEPEPTTEPAAEAIPSIEERSLSLSVQGENIWNSSEQFLAEHGYVVNDQNTAILKNAVLASLGLTEEGAHFLPVGFEFHIPFESLKDIPKA